MQTDLFQSCGCCWVFQICWLTECNTFTASSFWVLLNCGLEKTLESPLDYKKIQAVYPKGNQSWIFIGRTDAEAETPVHWPLDVKNWLTRKDPDAGKDWMWEKGTREDETVIIQLYLQIFFEQLYHISKQSRQKKKKTLSSWTLHSEKVDWKYYSSYII